MIRSVGADMAIYCENLRSGVEVPKTSDGEFREYQDAPAMLMENYFSQARSIELMASIPCRVWPGPTWIRLLSPHSIPRRCLFRKMPRTPAVLQSATPLPPFRANLLENTLQQSLTFSSLCILSLALTSILQSQKSVQPVFGPW